MNRKPKPAEIEEPPNFALRNPVLRQIRVTMLDHAAYGSKPHLCVSLDCLETILEQEGGLIAECDVSNFLEMLLIRAHHAAVASNAATDGAAERLWRGCIDDRRSEEEENG